MLIETTQKTTIDNTANSTTTSAPGGDLQELKSEKAYSKKTHTLKTNKAKPEILRGQAHIHASYNNTIVSITNPKGDVLVLVSSGMKGFKGPKKSTPYAASEVVKEAVERLKPYGMREVEVFVSGIGGGRESAIKALNANGLYIVKIKDVTPMAHNGCRPPRARRV